MSYVLPLPSAGSLRCSNEVSFLEILSPQPFQAEEFQEQFCTIDEYYPTKPFVPREYTTKLNEHTSPFLSLLHFLSKANPEAGSTLVIIAGDWYAAQIEILTTLFPSINIHLWTCKVTGRLPNSVVRKFGFPTSTSYPITTNLYLFSEYRTTGNILNDLGMQGKLIETCQPKLASLRFRLPFARNFSNTIIDFYDGTIHTMCYSSPKEIATRLIVTGKDRKLKPYNIAELEEKLNHYNTEVRTFPVWRDGIIKGTFDDCYRNNILSSLVGYDSITLWEDIVLACGSPKL